MCLNNFYEADDETENNDKKYSIKINKKKFKKKINKVKIIKTDINSVYKMLSVLKIH
jgi:hypothetical protein